MKRSFCVFILLAMCFVFGCQSAQVTTTGSVTSATTKIPSTTTTGSVTSVTTKTPPITTTSSTTSITTKVPITTITSPVITTTRPTLVTTTTKPNESEQPDIYTMCTIFVNDMALQTKGELIVKNGATYAVLPLIALLSAFDTTITWNGDTATIVWEGVSFWDEPFTLNTQAHTLKPAKANPYGSYLSPDPDEEFFVREKRGSEYWVSSNLLKRFLRDCGYKIVVDVESQTVSVLPLQTEPTPCRLVVNGKELSGAPAFLNKDQGYAVLPLVLVLKELGATVTWQSNTVATVILNGETYRLDGENFSLVKGGLELLLPAPGDDNYVCEWTDGELFAGDTLLRYFFGQIGYQIRRDYENETVSVQKTT